MKPFLIMIRIFFLLASIFCCLSTLIYYEVIFDQIIPPSKIVSVIIFSTGLLFIYCALSGWPEVIRFTEYIKTMIRGKRKNAKTTKVAKLSGLLSGLGTWVLIVFVLGYALVFSEQVLGIEILETSRGHVIFGVLLFLLGPVLAVFVGKFINFMWGSYSNSRKYLINIISSLIVLAELFILIQPNPDTIITQLHENGQMRSKEIYYGKESAKTSWYENGQKRSEATYKDGKLDGLSTAWHENGQKSAKVTFKDGKPEGRAMGWHKNGQKESEETFKDGKKLSAKYWNSKGEYQGVNYDEFEFRERIAYLKGSDTPYTGKVFRLYKNGQKRHEVNYKDGNKVGLQTGWHSNGQKKGEGNFKDGKEDGLFVNWHANGQKQAEGNFKDGKQISAKFWNSKGEPVESFKESFKEAQK